MKKFKIPKLSKKKIILIIIAAIFAVIVLKAFIFKGTSIPSVDTVKATRGEIAETVEINGVVEPKDSAEITSPYNYEVVKILVKEGDKVKKGDVLAELDSSKLKDEIDLLSKQVKMQEMQYSEREADAKNVSTSTKTLELAVDDAQSALDEARRQEAMKKQLLDNGAIASEEYIESKLAAEKAASALDTAKEALESGKKDIQSRLNSVKPKASDRQNINISQTQLAQKLKALDDTKIKSQIDGVVTRVYTKLGRQAMDAKENKPMFVIEDLSEKHIKISVREQNVADIKIGQEAEITSQVMGDDKAKGRVSSISPTGEKDQNSSDTVVPVDIILDSNESRLLSGVTAKASIILKKEKNALQVPFNAIMDDGTGKECVFVVKNGKLKKISVKTGIESDFNTEILSSELKENDIVVLSPQPEFTDGMSVKMNSQAPPADKDKTAGKTSGKED